MLNPYSNIVKGMHQVTHQKELVNEVTKTLRELIELWQNAGKETK